jgi:hypothetical protein
MRRLPLLVRRQHQSSIITYKTLAIDVGELVILVRARRPLQLHVADIVARFDDDPPMQMDLETELGLAHILTFDT